MAIRLIAKCTRPDLAVMARAVRMLSLLAVLFTSPSLYAETDLEYRVKAAFLYNFTKFVDWPPRSFAAANAPLQLCVYGSYPFGPDLEKIVSGKSVDNRALQVRRVKQLADTQGCQVIYFGDSEGVRLAAHLQHLQSQAVLTISDDPRFLELGGMVRFLLVNNKVRFEINRSIAERTGLSISSKLLRVAHAVHDDAAR